MGNLDLPDASWVEVEPEDDDADDRWAQRLAPQFPSAAERPDGRRGTREDRTQR